MTLALKAAAAAIVSATGLKARAAHAQDRIALKIVHPFSNTHYLGERVNFTIYPARQLGKAAERLDIAASGVADLVLTATSCHPARLTVSGVTELPGAYDDICLASRALTELSAEGSRGRQHGQHLHHAADEPRQVRRRGGRGAGGVPPPGVAAAENNCTWMAENETVVPDRMVAENDLEMTTLGQEEWARWELRTAAAARHWVGTIGARGKPAREAHEAGSNAVKAAHGSELSPPRRRLAVPAESPATPSDLLCPGAASGAA